MKIFDPHFTRRPDRRTLRGDGEGRILAIVEPAFWLGQPRTNAGSFVDYFNSLLGWERFRASQFGIRHFCTIGLNPKEANNPKLAAEVIDLMPRFLAKDGVVAVGEVGFDDQTDAEEPRARRSSSAADSVGCDPAHAASRQEAAPIRTIDVVRCDGSPRNAC
jgi:predicted metal-dependent TIM-barrel fold hydrolase